MKIRSWSYPIMKNVVDFELTGKYVESKKGKHICELKKDGKLWKPKNPAEKIEIENIKELIKKQIEQKAITLK